MTAIAEHLEGAGYETFLPHRDGIESYAMGLVNSPLNVNIFKIRDLVDRAIFALDIYQIVERCDYFVFNMNGRVPDEGGLVETGIAFSVGKPIVIYKNDTRTAFNGRDNSMITGLVYTRKVSDINKISEELERTISVLKKIGNKPLSANDIPVFFARTVGFGSKVWQLIESRPKKMNEDTLIDEIVRAVKKFHLKGE